MSEDVKMPENGPEEKSAATGRKSKRPWWVRAVKWIGITAGCIVALLIAVCTLVVWILTPGRLTPLVEKYASEYLNADVSIKRVELTFWHTFPEFSVEVDSLTVVSHALDGVADSLQCTLPADADTLLTLKHFNGGLNIAELMIGRLALHDVEFVEPAVNLVQVNDSVANFLILPPSEPAAPEAAAVALPHISINRFSITGAGPLRYRSLADSLDFAVNLRNLAITDHGEPTYLLDLVGNARSPMLGQFNFSNVAFGANGRVDWDASMPMALKLSDFEVKVHEYSVKMNLAVDFTSVPMVNEFEAVTSDISVGEALSHVPQEFAEFVKPLETDMKARANVKLTRPWNMADSLMPSLKGAVVVPACHVVYQQLKLKSFAAEMEFDFDGTDMDASVFNVKRLMAKGNAIEINVAAKVMNAVSDPRVEGLFNGSVNLGRLPRVLMQRLGGTMTGTLTGHTTFALKMSDLSPANFHRLNAKGNLTLSDFHAETDSLGTYYTRSAQFEFGSNTKFVAADRHTIDSLLTVSLKIDTLSAMTGGMDIRVSDFKAGAGAVNKKSSADTTEINPFGFSVRAGRLIFDSPADTLRLRMRNASIGGVLRRYEGEARMPQVNLHIDVDRLFGGQALNKIALMGAKVQLDVHKRRRVQRTASQRDSLRVARRRQAIDASPDSRGGEKLKIDMDSTERGMLRRWDFNGHISARGGRVITPYFPLRNSLRHIDFRFSQDSIALDSLRYRAGQSDFLVSGSITNLRRALLARRNNTLGVKLSVESDTVNVNELVRALFAGTSVSQQVDSAMIWNDSESDRLESRLDQMADTASTGPLLIPHNLDARLSLRATNVIYADLLLHNLRGDMMIYDGALNLSNLSAQTDIGSISLDGLYDGARTDSLQFGMGMKVNRFHLDRLTSIIPAIDSIMPMMQSFAGIVNADVAVTTDLEPNMDINIPTLRAAIKLSGDSLVLLDPDTFKMLSKWLFFRHKDRNMIDHMSVEAVVENSVIELFPFMFNIDRYKLGVMGSNDMNMNLNYHVSVLKSPIPFKFGINIKGTPDKMKIRLGGAKVKEKMVGERQTIAATTRVNIVEQINSLFRKGINRARRGRLNMPAAAKSATEEAMRQAAEMEGGESLSYQDSLNFIRQGLIENPDTLRFPVK